MKKAVMKPEPLISLGVCLLLALLNLWVVPSQWGTDFLQLALWVSCGLLLLYALSAWGANLRAGGFPRTAARVLRRCMRLLALAGFLLFAAIQTVIITHQGGTAEPGADFVIILGSGLIDGLRPATPLQSRLDTALPYLRDNPDAVVILAGGQGSDELISEAESMRRYLVQHGVDDGRMLLEDTSRNTSQNFRFTRELIPSGASVVVVTNEFHMYRALTLAKINGIENFSALPAPTPTPLQRISNHVREFFSVILMYLGRQ